VEEEEGGREERTKPLRKAGGGEEGGGEGGRAGVWVRPQRAGRRLEYSIRAAPTTATAARSPSRECSAAARMRAARTRPPFVPLVVAT